MADGRLGIFAPAARAKGTDASDGYFETNQKLTSPIQNVIENHR